MDTRRQIAKFAAIFAGGTLISRVLGLVREMVITALVPGPARDVFYFAFQFPNMLRDLVGEGASNAAFIPVLSETLEKEKEQGFRELTASLMSALILVLGALTVLGLLFTPLITQFLQWIAPFTGGEPLSPEKAAQVTSLIRWLFPYIFFIGLTVFQMGPLFIKHHYATPSWGPALLNVTMILACWLAFRGWFANPVYALVAGVWAGGVAQLAVQNVAMRRYVGVWLPNFRLSHPGIRTALWLLLPVILGQSAGEVNKFINNTFAYSLGEGVRTAMWVSNIVVQLPLSIFGIAISVAILPSISMAAARKDFAEVRDTLMRGFRECFFLIAPAVAALLVLPGPIIRLLFQRLNFDAGDTELTSIAMAYLAMGLLFFAWVKVAVSGFYAVKDTRTPVTIAFISMAMNVVLLLALVRPLHFRSLPLATTLSYAVNFALLYTFLSRRYGRMWDASFLVSLARTASAAAATGVVLHAAAWALDHYWGHESFLQRVAMVAGPLGAGGLVYLGLCALTRSPELATFAGLVRRPGGLSRRKPVADEPVDDAGNGEL